MELKFSEETVKLIELELKDGGFESVDQLVKTSVKIMREHRADYFGDFEPGELDRLLREGEQSGIGSPPEVVHARIDAIIEAAKQREAARGK